MSSQSLIGWRCTSSISTATNIVLENFCVRPYFAELVDNLMLSTAGQLTEMNIPGLFWPILTVLTAKG